MRVKGSIRESSQTKSFKRCQLIYVSYHLAKHIFCINSWNIIEHNWTLLSMDSIYHSQVPWASGPIWHSSIHSSYVVSNKIHNTLNSLFFFFRTSAHVLKQKRSSSQVFHSVVDILLGRLFCLCTTESKCVKYAQKTSENYPKREYEVWYCVFTHTEPNQ